jgi:hypothetical protein
VPIQDTTIGIFSTATDLEMQARNISRSEAAGEVVTAFGLPGAEAVHGKDWLQVPWLVSRLSLPESSHFLCFRMLTAALCHCNRLSSCRKWQRREVTGTRLLLLDWCVFFACGALWLAAVSLVMDPACESVHHCVHRVWRVQISIASVVTMEQIAAFLAGENMTTAFDVSDAVLRQLTATAGGDVLTKVQDPTWVASAITSAATTASLPAPDTAKTKAVADSIVLVNKRLLDIQQGEGAGNTQKLLTGWAKAAHVGDVLFAEDAAKLGSGDMDETEFR